MKNLDFGQKIDFEESTAFVEMKPFDDSDYWPSLDVDVCPLTRTQ
jgi:hypothetical protein